MAGGTLDVATLQERAYDRCTHARYKNPTPGLSLDFRLIVDLSQTCSLQLQLLIRW